MGKIKYIKVKDMKNPTVKQMQIMAENLKNRLDTYASIKIQVNCFPHTSIIEVEYGIYTASAKTATHFFDSWSDLLQYYHELMREDIDE